MTPLKITAASVAICALLMMFAIQRTPAPAAAEHEEMFNAVWIDVMRPLALKNADLEHTAYSLSIESKPVVTERTVTPVPDSAPASMPPVILVQGEVDKPTASRHRRQRASNGTAKINMPICARHGMHKVAIRGGKSWQCRK